MAVAAPTVVFAVLAAPDTADSTVREAPPKNACPAPAVCMIQVEITGVDITPVIATITPGMMIYPEKTLNIACIGREICHGLAGGSPGLNICCTDCE